MIIAHIDMQYIVGLYKLLSLDTIRANYILLIIVTIQLRYVSTELVEGLSMPH